MECSLCKEEMLNVKDYNVFKNNAHIVSEFIICDKCLEHISSGGKFIKAISLSNNLDYFSKDTQEALNQWISYKNACGDKYTERGKQTLLTRIINEIKATSNEVVIAKIRNSITHKWKGICWSDNSFLKPQIIELFEKTWNDLIINTEGKEGAKRYYLYLFKALSDIEKIKIRARQIYIAYKRYIDNLNDDKYCKTFYNWLKSEVPLE